MSEEEVKIEKSEEVEQEHEGFVFQLTENNYIANEFLVPGRVLDVLASFADSSINQPPLKMLRDGSYWNVETVWTKIINESNAWKQATCVFFDTWKYRGYICLLDERIVIEVLPFTKKSELWTKDINLRIVARSRCRSLRLFDIIRKLKYYDYRISRSNY